MNVRRVWGNACRLSGDDRATWSGGTPVIGRSRRRTGRRPGLSPAYGLLGLWWMSEGGGFPFGTENDPEAALSILGDVRAETGAPVIVVLGCVGTGVAVTMARARGRGVLRAVLLGFAWTIAVVLVPVAARWGRWAVYVAVVVPVLYAATRWAWALGIPLGISEEVLREGQEIGLWWAGVGLATMAVGGAVLTLGLIRGWGEVFPRWIPFLHGKRVPIPLAVVPASLVSLLGTAAGLMFVRMTFAGTLGESFDFFGEGR